VYFWTTPPGNGSLGLMVPNPVLTLTLAVVGAGLIVKSGPTFANSVIEFGVPRPLGPSKPGAASQARVPAAIAADGVYAQSSIPAPRSDAPFVL
jgi:hypothetical protein